jgi:hypothetical protein
MRCLLIKKLHVIYVLIIFCITSYNFQTFANSAKYFKLSSTGPSKSTLSNEKAMQSDILRTQKKYDKAIADLPLVSKAEIRRGKSVIPIDLKNLAEHKKIKDKDLIVLGPGRYEDVIVTDAKDITIEGQGKNETVLGSRLINGKGLDYKLNNPLFAKLTLIYPFFVNVTDKAYGCTYYFAESRIVGGNVANTKSKPASIIIYLSEIINLYSNHSYASTIVTGEYSYVETFSKVGRGQIEKLRFFDDGPITTYFYNYDKMNKWSTSKDYQTAKKNFQKTQFAPLNQEGLQAAFSLLQGKVKNRGKTPEVDLMFNYFTRAHGFKLDDKQNEVYNKLAVLAKEANAKKRYLTASLAAGLALYEMELSKEGKALEKLYREYLMNAANTYSCDRDRDDKAYDFNRVMEKIYPILNLDADKSDCKLNYVVNYEKQEATRQNTGFYTTPIYTEDPQQVRRRNALARAANEARENLWKAKGALAVDRLSQAGKNASQSLSRSGQVGNTTYLVYGKGNFSTKEDPLLKYNKTQAEQRLSEIQKAGVGTGAPMMQVTDYKKTNTYIARNTLDYEATLKADFGGGKKVLVKGPMSRMIDSRSCKEGFGVYATDSTKCGSLETDMYPYRRSYIQKEILPYFEEAFFENRIQTIIQSAKTIAEQNTDEDLLESYLLSLGLNLDVDVIKFEALTEKLLGKKVNFAWAKALMFKDKKS